MHVQIKRLGDIAGHCALHAVAVPGNHRDLYAFERLQLRQLLVLKITVPRRVHFLGAVQVQPQLKALHHAIGLLGDFGVDHALACGHPLHTAVLQQAFVARAVPVQHAPGDHVGHRFKTPVWVVRKTGNVVIRLVAAKCIEHQKRVQPLLQVLREDAAELDARAVGSGLTDDQALNTARVQDGWGRWGMGHNDFLSTTAKGQSRFNALNCKCATPCQSGGSWCLACR